jgi:hypothetical protein
VRLEWSSHGGDACLRIIGSRRDLQQLRIYPSDLVEAARASALAPLEGEYVWGPDGDAVSFVPRFPFVGGMSYTVLGSDFDDVDPVTITWPEHDAGECTSHVVEIHPTAGEVPRNLLRCYVHFSDRMSEGFVASHVRVVDSERGDPIDGAFLPMEPELWDRARRRVTLLFDPARIKRGLAPHREVGYPLHVDAMVDVVVDDGFRDAAGRQLTGTHTRRYLVGPDVRRRVDPAVWEVGSPPAGSRDPLVVQFDRPLDHALLQHCLTVVPRHDDSTARQVAGSLAGSVHVPIGEATWRFTPTEVWTASGYDLVVDTKLEDLAGNSVARVFDRDLADHDHTPLASDRVAVGFVVR